MGKAGNKTYGKVHRDVERKGSSVVKKQDPKLKAKPVMDDTEESEPNVPIKLQQLLLNIFRDSFSTLLKSDQLQPILQEVKTALFEREFARAFSKEYLEAYTARWSPSRALCYQSIFIDIQKHLKKMASLDFKPKTTLPEDGTSVQPSIPCLNAISFGGGAAEVIAFGGYSCILRNEVQAPTEDNPSGTLIGSIPSIDLTLIDSAAWEDVVKVLRSGLVEPPPLSKYANASAKAANKPLIGAESLETKFRMENALSMSLSQIKELIGGEPKFLSLLFTLNELYTESISKTTAFLLNLTMATKKGSLLLVVDSPGSYSTTSVGTDEKKYPM